jgi:CBS domain-containing protein
MSQNNIGSVVITETENNLPVGIITERDVVHIAGTTEILLTQLVASDIMSKQVITINSEFHKRCYRDHAAKEYQTAACANNEKKTMVGIVTDSDIFRTIMRSQSIITTVSQSIVIEQYRPVYERLSQFMLGEMLLPTRSANQ